MCLLTHDQNDFKEEGISFGVDLMYTVRKAEIENLRQNANSGTKKRMKTK